MIFDLQSKGALVCLKKDYFDRIDHALLPAKRIIVLDFDSGFGRLCSIPVHFIANKKEK